MIHPEHGDDALVHRHRRADRRARCCATLAREVADVSFNCATVDGDTSTNDSFVLAATGKARACAPIARADDPRLARAARRADRGARSSSRRRSCATAKARPSSSPSRVEGGRDVDECRRVALGIAHSPLVKTAFFASDPNLGRIVCAIGNAGVAGPRSRRACRSGSTTCWSSTAAGARPLPRGGRPARDEAGRDHGARRARPRRRARRRCGPATSRTTT